MLPGYPLRCGGGQFFSQKAEGNCCQGYLLRRGERPVAKPEAGSPSQFGRIGSCQLLLGYPLRCGGRPILKSEIGSPSQWAGLVEANCCLGYPLRCGGGQFFSQKAEGNCCRGGAASREARRRKSQSVWRIGSCQLLLGYPLRCRGRPVLKP